MNVWNLNGFKGIGDRENSCAQWDEFPSESIRVPGSVPSLVMMGDHHRGFTEERKRLEQHSSEAWVILNRHVRVRLKPFLSGL